MERRERRCLVIADGWYEWLKSEKKGEPRVPFRYTVDGGEPFAFAGLWDVRRIGGELGRSATILTTTRERGLRAGPRPHAGACSPGRTRRRRG